MLFFSPLRSESNLAGNKETKKKGLEERTEVGISNMRNVKWR